MISLRAYRQSPCSLLSIPYWKAKTIVIPDHMRIVHADSFAPAQWVGWADTPYFRLRHDLMHIPPTAAESYAVCTATEADIPTIIEIINRSYTDLSMEPEQIADMKMAPVFCPDLWIVALDKTSNAPVGCGIADLDQGAGEGILEWIQVLPEYRGQHVGRLLVQELLHRMQGRAQFATVSGQCQNPTDPESLYRSCGFTGSDVWHVLCQTPR